MFLNESTLNIDVNDASMYNEGISSLLEASLESEMAWSNLMEDAYQREAYAIKMEDVQLMNEADGNTFQKILQWIKDRIAALTAAVKRTLLSLTAKCTNIDKFVATYNSPAMKEKKKRDEAPVSSPEIGAMAKAAKIKTDSNIDQIANNILNMVAAVLTACNKATSADALKEVKKYFKVDELIYDSKKSVTIKMKYSEALTDLNKAKSVIDKLCKASHNKHVAYLNMYHSRLKSAKDGKEKKDSYSLDVKKLKTGDSLSSAVYSKGIAACYVHMGVCIKAVKACFKEDK